MKYLCDFYIRHAGWIGAAYCAIPNLAWFLGTFVFVPFRTVYLLRLSLSLLVGCVISAYLNRYGVDTWLRKHRSNDGPATIIDGVIVGAAVGIGSALLPTLSALISSSSLEKAKTIIIITYLAATSIGAIFGAGLARIAQKYIETAAIDKVPISRDPQNQ